MKYVQTKEQCQANIYKNGNVCDGCGGELTPNETFDNARNPTYWVHCENCLQFTNGVKPNIFAISKFMVDENGFEPANYYPEGDYYRAAQLRAASRIVEKIISIHDKMQNNGTV